MAHDKESSRDEAGYRLEPQQSHPDDARLKGQLGHAIRYERTNHEKKGSRGEEETGNRSNLKTRRRTPVNLRGKARANKTAEIIGRNRIK